MYTKSLQDSKSKNPLTKTQRWKTNHDIGSDEAESLTAKDKLGHHQQPKLLSHWETGHHLHALRSLFLGEKKSKLEEGEQEGKRVTLKSRLRFEQNPETILVLERD